MNFILGLLDIYGDHGNALSHKASPNGPHNCFQRPCVLLFYHRRRRHIEPIQSGFAATDYTLPLAVVNTFLFASICLVQAAVISATANYMAAAIPFCLVVIYFIQRFYLRTSRQLRSLDIEAKAPLYTNFKETILDMNTIRAYGGEFGSFLKEKHVKVLDDSQQPIYLLYTVQRWLSLVLDLVVACLATLLIVVAVQTRPGTSGSDMGVALVNLTSFNQYLTMLIRCWASVETSLGAIARIKDFSHETPVADGCGHEPKQDYDGDRSIVFEDVSVVYKKPQTSLESAEDSSEDTSDLNLNHQALDSINLTIRSGTKLAITGRSGSGKSTLVSSLDETSARVVRDRIKVEFEDYIILSIVHKFDGVIEDMDEMIIMDQGRVARRGLPRQLLQAM
jgi:ABC-type multidrug transport system fused ATPase/permease subunit